MADPRNQETEQPLSHRSFSAFSPGSCRWTVSRKRFIPLFRSAFVVERRIINFEDAHFFLSFHRAAAALRPASETSSFDTFRARAFPPISAPLRERALGNRQVFTLENFTRGPTADQNGKPIGWMKIRADVFDGRDVLGLLSVRYQAGPPVFDR
jgi:hypothetical protein